MGSLEVQVTSVLRPMMAGEPIELRRVDVCVLRAWATKTALNFGYAAKGLEIEMPANVGQVLYQGRADYGVPPGTEVWIAAYDDPLETFAFRYMLSRGSGRHPVTGEEHQLLRVIFVAGRALSMCACLTRYALGPCSEMELCNNSPRCSIFPRTSRSHGGRGPGRRRD